METGLLRYGGFDGPAAQRYQYAFETGQHVCVRFEDGRVFHTLNLAAGGDVQHDCPPDGYRGRYRIHGPDHWSLSWTIHGPRKHLRIATGYFRAESDRGDPGLNAPVTTVLSHPL